MRNTRSAIAIAIAIAAAGSCLRRCRAAKSAGRDGLRFAEGHGLQDLLVRLLPPVGRSHEEERLRRAGDGCVIRRRARGQQGGRVSRTRTRRATPRRSATTSSRATCRGRHQTDAEGETGHRRHCGAWHAAGIARHGTRHEGTLRRRRVHEGRQDDRLREAQVTRAT